MMSFLLRNVFEKCALKSVFPLMVEPSEFRQDASLTRTRSPSHMASGMADSPNSPRPRPYDCKSHFEGVCLQF